jgi:hypothetical protein
MTQKGKKKSLQLIIEGAVTTRELGEADLRREVSTGGQRNYRASSGHPPGTLR